MSAEIVDESPMPWGLWATLGFSLLVGGVWQLVGSVVLVIYAGVAAGAGGPCQTGPRNSLRDSGPTAWPCRW